MHLWFPPAQGYFYQLVNNCFTAGYSLYLRGVMDRVKTVTSNGEKLNESSMVGGAGRAGTVEVGGGRTGRMWGASPLLLLSALACWLKGRAGLAWAWGWQGGGSGVRQ